jgi:hypothetical protein
MQRIRFAGMQFDYRDITCCHPFFQLIVIIHDIVLNIKIKILKLVKFHVTSGVVTKL